MKAAATRVWRFVKERFRRLRTFRRLLVLECVLGRLAACTGCGLVIDQAHASAVRRGENVMCKWCAKAPMRVAEPKKRRRAG